MSRLLAALALAPLLVGGTSAAVPAAASARHVVLTFHDPRIVEASGLVVQDGLFTTVNDSGDTGRVFTVDSTGRTVGVTSWGDDAIDDEALAPLPHHRVLVGDVGDDLDSRDAVTLRIVPVGRGDRTVTPTTYRLTYPGGAVDAETLMVQPGTGRVLVVTKELFGGTVLIAPRRLRTDGPNRLRPIGHALPIATDGAFFPDGRHLIVRGYGEAAVYTYPGLREVGRFRLPSQPQGEGIAVDERGRVFLSSEGVASQVLRVRLPTALDRAVTAPAPAPSAPPSPPPVSSSPAPAPAVGTDDVATGPPLWPWLIGGVVGVGVLLVLLRSLRPR